MLIAASSACGWLSALGPLPRFGFDYRKIGRQAKNFSDRCGGTEREAILTEMDNPGLPCHARRQMHGRLTLMALFAKHMIPVAPDNAKDDP